MATPLNRIIIFVGDVEKCAAFYRDAFGFVALPGNESPSEWIELDTGGCRLAFHKARGPGGPIESPTGGPNNPHKIVFQADDVAAERAKLVSRGVTMGKVHQFGSLTLCDGRDPEGHVFQLSNRP
jgi:predicted enzyme related to lactoylglutathione lyase